MNKLIPKYQTGTTKSKVRPISNRIGNWLHNQGYHEIAKEWNSFNNDMKHVFSDLQNLGFPTSLNEVGAMAMSPTPVGNIAKATNAKEALQIVAQRRSAAMKNPSIKRFKRQQMREQWNNSETQKKLADILVKEMRAEELAPIKETYRKAKSNVTAKNEVQLANKFGVKAPSVNRRPNGKGYYNNNALNANVLNENEKVQGIKITRKPWVPQQRHYVKEGQDVAEMLGLETFIAPNGKGYARLPNNKVKSLESIGTELNTFDKRGWNQYQMDIKNFADSYGIEFHPIIEK